MKVQTECDPFVDAVQAARRATSAKSSSPVMCGILLDTEDDRLTVAGYDYETSVRATLPAEVAEPGRVLVSGRLLVAIVKTLPAKPVSLSIDGSAVRLECGTATFTLPTLPAEDYPVLPVVPEVAGQVDAAQFASAVAQVAPAAEDGDARPVLQAVQIATEGGALRLVCTDRYRVARRTIDWQPASGVEGFIALPHAGILADAVRLAGDGMLTLAVQAGEHGGVFAVSSDTLAVTTRMFGEKYPATDKMFTFTPTTAAVMETADLLAAVQRASAVSARMEETKVRIEYDGSMTTVEVVGVDSAAGQDFVVCELAGDPMAFYAKATYLINALKTFTTPEVRLSHTDPLQRFVLDSPGEGGPDHQHMIMPIRPTDGDGT